MFARACLLLLVATVAASAGNGQPPGRQEPRKIPSDKLPAGPPFDTAFPDLKPRIPDEKGQVSDFPLPPFPVLATDAPPLRKVQFEQLREGLSYLYRVESILSRGNFNSQFFHDYIKMATETYRIAAELEDTPAKRIPWYEARVRQMKEAERFTKLRGDLGATPPQDFNLARFARLQAEADLLKLKAEVETPALGAPIVCTPVVVTPRLFRRR